MTDIEPFSKSQQKQNAKDITDLGNQLAQLSEAQLSALPYPEIEAAIKEYKRITKGNARKRQMLYIGKLLRHVDLAAIEDLIDRYDSRSTRIVDPIFLFLLCGFCSGRNVRLFHRLSVYGPDRQWHRSDLPFAGHV